MASGQEIAANWQAGMADRLIAAAPGARADIFMEYHVLTGKSLSQLYQIAGKYGASLTEKGMTWRPGKK